LGQCGTMEGLGSPQFPPQIERSIEFERELKVLWGHTSDVPPPVSDASGHGL
jgi:hypothetical protein